MSDNDDVLREVWYDTDAANRREFWTDGEWIKVGRDVDDPDMCVTFRADDNHYDEFRRGEHPKRVTIEDDRGSSETYIVECDGFKYRFYKGRAMVLEVPDHELGAIRSVYQKAREFREAEYDWEDTARSFVKSLFPNAVNFEIAELDISDRSRRGGVTVVHERNVVCASDPFIEAVKESPHTDWTGVYHDGYDGSEEPCDGFRYEFTVDAHSVREGYDA